MADNIKSKPVKTTLDGTEAYPLEDGSNDRHGLISAIYTYCKSLFDSIYATIVNFDALEDRVEMLEDITTNQTYYLDNSSSDIGGYEQLLETPITVTGVTEVVAINSNTVIIDSYATILDIPGLTEIPAGVWTIHAHIGFSSVTGDNYAHFDMYKRASGGTETLLFRMSTDDISETGEQIYLLQVAQSSVSLIAGDRLVLKVYAQTTGNAKNATLYYSGTEKFAFMQPPAFNLSGSLVHDNLQGGSTIAATGVDVGHVSNSEPLQLPELTTTERDAIGSPNEGMKIFNTTDSEEQIYIGAAWASNLAGGHVYKENGTPITVRSGRNVVTNAFAGLSWFADDSGNDESDESPQFFLLSDVDPTGKAAGDVPVVNATNDGIEMESSATFDIVINTPEANLTADVQLSAILEAGYKLDTIIIKNTTANAVTGGIDIGTTASGNDIVSAEAVGASAVVDATIIQEFWSDVNDTDLYISAVTAWNSANLTLYFTFIKVI